jgi:hypothetical protein
VEKTIPKGTKMYRTTPREKDGRSGKSAYVTYTDVDRDMYKAGHIIKKYVGGKDDDPVFEHEYELTSDIRIPSLNTVRRIQDKVMLSDKNRIEVGKAYVEEFMLNEGWTLDQINACSKAAKKLEKSTSPEQDQRVRKELYDKYGEYDGDSMYYESKHIRDAKNWVNTRDSLLVERSFGKAVNTKNAVITELKKMGYNAMYDNASIGVLSDGRYNRRQEGIEPLIIFDADSTMRETANRKIDAAEQRAASDRYDRWLDEKGNVLKDFSDYRR